MLREKDKEQQLDLMSGLSHCDGPREGDKWTGASRAKDLLFVLWQVLCVFDLAELAADVSAWEDGKLMLSTLTVDLNPKTTKRSVCVRVRLIIFNSC